MLSIQTFARGTGFLYLLLVPLGLFGIEYVANLEVSGDITATIANILANETTIRWAMFSAILIQLIHFALVLCLYKLLRPVSEAYAKIMVLLVMVGVPIALLNEASFGALLMQVGDVDPSAKLISLLFDFHKYGIVIVQIFWGLWLFPFGDLVYKSDFLPKFIGVFLMIGCFGYLIDSLVYIIDPNFPIKLAIYLFWGELIITLWLLIKGVNVEKWNQKNGN